MDRCHAVDSLELDQDPSAHYEIEAIPRVEVYAFVCQGQRHLSLKVQPSLLQFTT
jgi:hypothetical protein